MTSNDCWPSNGFYLSDVFRVEVGRFSGVIDKYGTLRLPCDSALHRDTHVQPEQVNIAGCECSAIWIILNLRRHFDVYCMIWVTMQSSRLGVWSGSI
jgi:hypothetical protein